MYTLRTAKPEDAELLFKIKKEAMSSISSRTEPFDYDKEFAEYLKKFEPEKVQVIQYEGEDIGRLRVVRSPESIYIGGIQILPVFQNKGIGTAILKSLVTESDSSGVPIKLEVHHVNEKAISLYTRLGFRETGKTETQVIMECQPRVTL